MLREVDVVVDDLNAGFAYIVAQLVVGAERVLDVVAQFRLQGVEQFAGQLGFEQFSHTARDLLGRDERVGVFDGLRIDLEFRHFAPVDPVERFDVLEHALLDALHYVAREVLAAGLAFERTEERFVLRFDFFEFVFGIE